jgi:hypothetical protein
LQNFLWRTQRLPIEFGIDCHFAHTNPQQVKAAAGCIIATMPRATVPTKPSVSKQRLASPIVCLPS